MWPIVLILVLCVANIADAKQSMRVILTGNSNAQVLTPKLVENEFFKLIIDKSAISFERKLRSISCFDSEHEDTKLYDHELVGNGPIYFYHVKAVKKMETTWTCKIGPGPFEIKTTFNVAFKKSGYINVSVNTKNVNLTNVEDTRFDELGEYMYNDGELAKFVCQRTKGKYLYMALFTTGVHEEFKNVTTAKIKDTESVMFVKLMKEHANAYLECTVYTTIGNPIHSTVRVNLTMRKHDHADIDVPKLRINDLALVPSQNVYNEHVYYYYYEYNDEEKVSITDVTKKINNYWNCSIKKSNESDKAIEIQDTINVTNYLKNNSEVEFSGTSSSAISVNLKLVPSSIFSYADLRGLTFPQTLMKYQKSNTEYLSVYDNVGNKNLTLTCSSKTSSKCKWEHDKNVLRRDESVYGNLKHKALFSRLTNVTCASIKCHCYNEKNYTYHAEILYHPDEEYITESTLLPDLYNVTTVRSADQTNPSNVHTDPNGVKKLMMFVAIAAATVLVIAVCICMTVGIYKRKRRLERAEASNVNYENLPDHNEGPMPVPTQWNEYARPADLQPQDTTYSVPYVEKNVNEMYAKPVPKSKRNQPPPSEPLYAEATQPEPNYDRVAPTGGQRPNGEYVNLDLSEPPYAQIQPVRFPNAKYKQVLPRATPKNAEDDYAQVVPPKYVNVFDNQRYANTQNHTSEYAEPAYCDVPN